MLCTKFSSWKKLTNFLTQQFTMFRITLKTCSWKKIQPKDRALTQTISMARTSYISGIITISLLFSIWKQTGKNRVVAFWTSFAQRRRKIPERPTSGKQRKLKLGDDISLEFSLIFSLAKMRKPLNENSLQFSHKKRKREMLRESAAWDFREKCEFCCPAQIT